MICESLLTPIFSIVGIVNSYKLLELKELRDLLYKSVQSCRGSLIADRPGLNAARKQRARDARI